MATARHPKATFFVQRHLFAGLTSFADLEQKIAALPDEQSRGAAFEVFAEPISPRNGNMMPRKSGRTVLSRSTSSKTWPHATRPGCGGVLQTLLGQFNAYQIKFRTGRPSLTWANSPPSSAWPTARTFTAACCSQLRRTARRPQRPQGFFCIRGADLDRLEAGDFRAMEAWLADAAFIAPKKSPQPHQTEHWTPCFLHCKRTTAFPHHGLRHGQNSRRTLVAESLPFPGARIVPIRSAWPDRGA